MPKLHRYVPSSSKEGFYIYANHHGQNVTYQVTSIARRIFEKLGYGDGTEITGEMLYALHRLRLIYTNKSAVEPPSSFDDVTDEIEPPSSTKGDRKRFFKTILKEANLDSDERRDLGQYLESQDIDPKLQAVASSRPAGDEWRPAPPDGGELYRGTVDFFNDTGGYGFIDSPLLDEDVFYHMEDIGGRDVQEDTTLEFRWRHADEGPRATHIRPIDSDAPTGEKRVLGEGPLADRPPLDEFQIAKSYAAQLEITFLGTGGTHPTENRVTNAVWIDRDGESFLFDVGEGTQRQMFTHDVGFSLDKIFLTSTETDHVGGLGPLLETLSMQQQSAELKLYVPADGVERIESLLDVYGDVDYPVNVCPVTDGVVCTGDTYTITAFKTDDAGERRGYVLEEPPRRGEFNRPLAEDLGVSPGPAFTRLCEGEPVTTDDEEEIDPRVVVGDPTPGRKVVYTGDVGEADDLVEAVADATLLIHEAAHIQEHKADAGVRDHATGREAGQTARKADAQQLVLTGISPRSEHRVETLVREAEAEFESDVTVVGDGDTITLPLPQSKSPPEVVREANDGSRERGSSTETATSSRKSTQQTSSQNRRDTESNPFKSRSNKLKNLVRKKH